MTETTTTTIKQLINENQGRIYLMTNYDECFCIQEYNDAYYGQQPFYDGGCSTRFEFGLDEEIVITLLKDGRYYSKELDDRFGIEEFTLLVAKYNRLLPEAQ